MALCFSDCPGLRTQQEFAPGCVCFSVGAGHVALCVCVTGTQQEALRPSVHREGDAPPSLGPP